MGLNLMSVCSALSTDQIFEFQDSYVSERQAIAKEEGVKTDAPASTFFIRVKLTP